jgi:two-component system sensor histidine kinase ChiS
MNQTVLVVDDEPLMLSSLKRLLKREGYDVLLAAGGVEGLNLARQAHPSVIVLDMRMPEMDGASFLAAMRDDEHLGHTRVIAISANVDQLPRGVAATFAKPFEPGDLMTEIRKLCPRA